MYHFGENPLTFTSYQYWLAAGRKLENLWNLPISIPKPDLYNIDTNTKFGENPLINLSSGKEKSGVSQIDSSVCQKLAIPNHVGV